MSRGTIIIADKHGNRTDLISGTMTPAVINPPLLTKHEAVARCGISVKEFDALVREGIFPQRVPGTRMWHRKHLYETLEIRKMPTDELYPGYVYFMEMGRFIKIGWSTLPRSRQETLQTGNPYDIKLLGAFPGSLGNEAGLHELFSHARARGEWFRKTPGLLAYIAWLKIVWRGNANIIAGDLDNVVRLENQRTENIKAEKDEIS